MALCALASGAVAAEPTWPVRPITAVAVFAAGGTADGVTRIVSQKLSTVLGQQVVVENRAGGGGTVGAAAVARATPDGYTLLMLVSSHAVGETLYKGRKYDLLKDFAPISLIGTSPYWLLVNPHQTKAQTVAELMAAARSQPGKLTFASGGVGALAHLAAEMMKSQKDVDIVHVPYKGAGPALTDLLGGRIDMLFDQPLSSEQFVKAGKLKPLAVTSSQRIPSAPAVPTMAESGFPGFEAIAWFAVAAPAGTPTPVLEQLSKAIHQVLGMADVRAKLEEVGVTPKSSSPAELEALIRTEIPRWRSVVEKAQIKVE
jgi:tripartite-type tricarboxylate transporter receptor subunit TctC